MRQKERQAFYLKFKIKQLGFNHKKVDFIIIIRKICEI